MARRPRVVYLLRSRTHPAQRYIGITRNLKRRLSAHNAGRCRHTAKFRPWQIVAAVYVPDPKKALELEGYLKSGSGRAFAKRHFE